MKSHDVQVDGNLDRLRSICRHCGYASIIGMVAVLLFMALMFVVLVTSIAFPDVIDYANIDYIRSPGEFTRTVLMTICVLDIFSAMLWFFLLHTLHRTFVSIECEYTPFTYGNYRRLLTMATLVLLSWFMVLAQNLLGYTVNFVSETISTIAIAVLIYVLALVFRYGQFLQKESDETL